MYRSKKKGAQVQKTCIPSSNKFKKGVHPKSIGMLNSWTDPSGNSCPIFHQPILGDIAVVSLQHSNLERKKVWLQRSDKPDPMM